MDVPIPATVISLLRPRLIDDMNRRRFSRETQRSYIRDVGIPETFVPVDGVLIGLGGNGPADRHRPCFSVGKRA